MILSRPSRFLVKIGRSRESEHSDAEVRTAAKSAVVSAWGSILELEFILSEKGKRKFALKGFIYACGKPKTQNGATYWRCEDYHRTTAS